MDIDDLTTDKLRGMGIPQAVEELSGGDPNQRAQALVDLRRFVGDHSETLDSVWLEGVDELANNLRRPQA